MLQQLIFFLFICLSQYLFTTMFFFFRAQGSCYFHKANIKRSSKLGKVGRLLTTFSDMCHLLTVLYVEYLPCRFYLAMSKQINYFQLQSCIYHWCLPGRHWKSFSDDSQMFSRKIIFLKYLGWRLNLSKLKKQRHIITVSLEKLNAKVFKSVESLLKNVHPRQEHFNKSVLLFNFAKSASNC